MEFFFFGRAHPVVVKVQYENEIKYVLRLTQLSLCFIISSVGYKFRAEYGIITPNI